MKTNKNFILRNIAGEAILIPTGKAATEFNGMINLSEVAAFIWEHLDACADLSELADQIVAEFEVDKATALTDAQQFIDSLVKNKMVEL